jgi:2-(1,2-epoxy-1,2-dihydrophenyl)acetyl-CoA isomerase
VTGGAAGLIFAADLVAMDERAFIQPYYSEVGFAPDGGWTALLKTKIPVARAFSIQALNSRIRAEDALRLGLADRLAPADALDGVIDSWLDDLSHKSRETIRVTKRLLRREEDIAGLRRALEAERHAFLDLIAKPETALRMDQFLQ